MSLYLSKVSSYDCLLNERVTVPRKSAFYLRISQGREMEGLAIDCQ